MTSRPNPLLMGCSLADLQQKLLDPAADIAPLWNHFLALSRHDSEWFSPYTVLAALVTRDEGDRARARDAVMRLVEMAPEAEDSFEAQLHTHVAAAPWARWAIYYDWLADDGLFTEAEEKRVAEVLLDLAFVFPYQGLQARMRDFDNQLLSNAFCVATIGYIFGYKRGDSALGRRLYQHGVAWLRFLLNHLPEGGYSPEGSTYHEQIVLPLTLLSSLLLTETSHFTPDADSHGQRANGLEPTLLKLLDTSYRMIGPGALLPAWDAYGFQAATIRCGLAFLARVSGDNAPLELLRELNLWYRIGHPAWEIDDRLWTLVWWPNSGTSAQKSSPLFAPWMAQEVAGALQGPENRTRLFQCWDRCGGMLASGRAQVDPNAITFEAFGVPLLLDGGGHPGAEAIAIPEDTAAAYVGENALDTVKKYFNDPAMPTARALTMALDGSVGMSNALVFDDENWFVPTPAVAGHGEALHAAGALQVLRSDATEFYHDRYAATEVVRTSLLVDGHYAFVTDRVSTPEPHRITWNAYLRDKPAVTGGADMPGIVIDTAEGVHCDIVALQTGTMELLPIEGYPSQFAERRSTRMQHSLPAAKRHRIDMVLIPQLALEFEQELTGWQRSIGDNTDTVSLNDCYLTDAATQPDSPRIFRRTVRLAKADGGRLLLKVAIAGGNLKLIVNEQEIAPTTTQAGVLWPQSPGGMEWAFDVSAAVHEGDNDFCLIAPFFHGETLAGPVALWRGRAPLPVTAQREGDDSFRIDIGSETNYIVAERSGPGPWRGGSTDARYALLKADESIAAAEVRNLELPGLLAMESQAPCDFGWSPGHVELRGIAEGTGAALHWRESELRVDLGGSIDIVHRGSPCTLKLAVSGSRRVVYNGRALDARSPEIVSIGSEGDSFEIVLALGNETGFDAPEAKDAENGVEELYELAARLGRDANEEYLAALDSADWRIQIVGIELCGRFDLREAVPRLLELFAEGEAELPYPALPHWWRWSKMLRYPGVSGTVPPAPPEPLMVKRWRVKRAAVTALGKLGDSRAVKPLEAAFARGDDFFMVTSQLAVALGRLGDSGSTAVLETMKDHAEVNTRVHARLALALLKGEIDRAEFEASVGLS